MKKEVLVAKLGSEELAAWVLENFVPKEVIFDCKHAGGPFYYTCWRKFQRPTTVESVDLCPFITNEERRICLTFELICRECETKPEEPIDLGCSDLVCGAPSLGGHND